MRFALVQHDIIREDKCANHAIVERMLDDAKIAPGTFVLLPEMGDTGFSFNLDKIVDDESVQWGSRCARERSIYLQVGHAERGPDGRGRNCATVIAPDGEIVGQYQKVHPFSYGREIEHFTGGDHLLLVEIDGMCICPLICYDLRFPELWRIAARAGAEVVIIVASWPAARQLHWRSLLIARAIEDQAYIIAVNRVGRDPHLEYAGESMIISPEGKILAEGDDRPRVLQADLDLNALRDWRAKFPALRDIHDDLLGSIHIERVACAFTRSRDAHAARGRRSVP